MFTNLQGLWSAYLFCLLFRKYHDCSMDGYCPKRVDNVLSQEGRAPPHKMNSLVQVLREVL